MEHDRGSYIVGFVLAVILTAIPFALVATHALAPSTTMLVIAVAAVLQILVHLRFFLHLTSSRRRARTCWPSPSRPSCFFSWWAAASGS